MNDNKMKNMVVIKDLPSNIVEEAYVVLKPNIKLKRKTEIINGKERNEETSPVYIIKEAENVISNYLSKIEDNKKIRNLEVEKIKKKYDNLKKFCMWLGGLLFFNILLQLVR